MTPNTTTTTVNAPTGKKKRGMAPDDPCRGATVQPVLLLFILGGLEICVWLWCNIQQINGTHDAVFSLIQGSLLVPSHLTPQEVLNFVQDNGDHANKIAYTLAFVTQVIFLLTAFPISYIHGHLAERFRYHPSGRSIVAHVKEVKRHLSVRRVIFLIFFIGDIWTDELYAAHNSHDWVTPVLYVLAMFAGSTIVGLDGWQRLSGVWIVISRALHQTQEETQES